MTTKTRVCNLALSHLGSGKEIAEVDTERSNEAAACRLFYDEARKEALRAFPWPFATRIQALALVATSPNNEWTYSYRYPADCIMHRRILSGIRSDNRQSRIPCTLGSDNTGQLIFTDQANAESEYTVDVINPTLWPNDFVMAFSYRLAAYIAPRITGGDPYKLGDKALNIFAALTTKAQAVGLAEEQVDEESDSESIRAREGTLRTSWI